ncbi:Elongation of very long chain fatty acids protein 5 [Hondaea fermentalgiana]|uniref:Elongation of fatty acids protein n=2 Tax=Thraustochytriidae TaxID=33674 RepID=A0A2R5G2T1_9STRA|nr:delta-6 fatty acid elongase [Thraustochytriaceae sp.]GBG25336.1 Elongation of very long chain fatty acids protein 5 [Hondaea fermentalgiana]|eukprot:GBG25336.1 Elongation of very long chain fatty acids protein 5 [Hondaea fermentalgiana]
MDVAMEQWKRFVETVDKGIVDFMEGEKTNEMNAGKPLISTEEMMALIVGYLAFVVFGSGFMKVFVEKPFELKYLKLAHNIFLTGLSMYMATECARQAYLGGYKLFGNPMEKGNEAHAPGMANIIYIFYVSKFLEFLDTVFMILGKKWKQLSFLHVYHHASISFIWGIIARFAPGGDAYFSTILNSCVHVMLYGYYASTTLGYGFMRPLRPYITTIQLTQFMAMVVQSVYDFYNPCDYPQPLVKLLFWYMLTMLGLFGNFFVQQYLKPKPATKKQKTI